MFSDVSSVPPASWTVALRTSTKISSQSMWNNTDGVFSMLAMAPGSIVGDYPGSLVCGNTLHSMLAKKGLTIKSPVIMKSAHEDCFIDPTDDHGQIPKSPNSLLANIREPPPGSCANVAILHDVGGWPRLYLLRHVGPGEELFMCRYSLANISTSHRVCTGCLDYSYLRGDELGFNLLKETWGKNGLPQSQLLKWGREEDEWFEREKEEKRRKFLALVDQKNKSEGHFIKFAYVKDQEGLVVAIFKFDPSNASPVEISFSVPNGTKSLRPFILCNIHGTWEGQKLDTNVTQDTNSLPKCVQNIVEEKEGTRMSGDTISETKHDKHLNDILEDGNWEEEDSDFEERKGKEAGKIKGSTKSDERAEKRQKQMDYISWVAESEEARQNLGYYNNENAGQFWENQKIAHIPRLERCGGIEEVRFTLRVDHEMTLPQPKKKRKKNTKKRKKVQKGRKKK